MLRICPQSPEQPWGDLRTKQLPQKPRAGQDRSLLSHLISHDKEFLAGAVESEGSLRQMGGWGRNRRWAGGGAGEPVLALQPSGILPESWTQKLTAQRRAFQAHLHVVALSTYCYFATVSCARSMHSERKPCLPSGYQETGKPVFFVPKKKPA